MAQVAGDDDARLFKRSYQVVEKILNDHDKNPGDKEALLEMVHANKRRRLNFAGMNVMQQVHKLHPCILRWLQLYAPLAKNMPRLQAAFQRLKGASRAPPQLHVRDHGASSLDDYLLEKPPFVGTEARLSWVYITCSRIAHEYGYTVDLPVQPLLDEFEFVVKKQEDAQLVIIATTRQERMLYRIHHMVGGSRTRRQMETYSTLSRLNAAFREILVA